MPGIISSAADALGLWCVVVVVGGGNVSGGGCRGTVGCTFGSASSLSGDCCATGTGMEITGTGPEWATVSVLVDVDMDVVGLGRSGLGTGCFGRDWTWTLSAGRGCVGVEMVLLLGCVERIGVAGDPTCAGFRGLRAATRSRLDLLGDER
jgi:hypothetical protein